MPSRGARTSAGRRAPAPPLGSTFSLKATSRIARGTAVAGDRELIIQLLSNTICMIKLHGAEAFFGFFSRAVHASSSTSRGTTFIAMSCKPQM